MHRFPVSTFCICLLLTLAQRGLRAQDYVIPVIPQPQQVFLFDAGFKIDPDCRIVLGKGNAEAERFAAEQINEQLQEEVGFRLTIANEEDISTWNKIIFLGNLKQSGKARELANQANFATMIEIGQQGYFFQSTDSLIVILANSSQGIFYGCMTLNQLLQSQNAPIEIQGMTVYDWPDLSLRGIRDDLSHGQIPNPDEFERLIRFLSRYKMNVYMPQILGAFPFASHPDITGDLDVPDKAGWSDLVAFAQKYYIDIIPVLPTLGHMESILGIPEYHDLAEFPGASILSPAKEEVYLFLEDLIAEVSKTFDSRYLHIGGCDGHQIGWGENGNLYDLQQKSFIIADHYIRVAEIARKYGKQVLLDSEMLAENPGVLAQIPDDIMMVDWVADDTRNDLTLLSRSGRQFMVGAHLTTRGGFFPDYLGSFPALQQATEQGHRVRATGAISANPTRVGVGFRELDYYGYAFTGESAWTTNKAEIAFFNQTFFRQFFGSGKADPQVVYTLLMELSDPTSQKEFFRHPFLPPLLSSEQMSRKIYSLKTSMQLITEMIDALSNELIENEEHLDYLRFAAEQGALLAKKLESEQRIDEITRQGYPAANDATNSPISDICLEMVEDLNQTMEHLQLLWLRQYRRDGLAHLLDLYGQQVDYWQEKMTQVQSGHLVVDPKLESQWIYPPNPRVNKKTGEIGPMFFRKTFEVQPRFKQAYLQAMADSHIKIYLNGGFLDEVVDASRLTPEIQGAVVKVWDITSLLQPGKNVIAIEARQYQPGRSPGLNLYCEVEYELDNPIQIYSDPYWKTCDHEEPNWRKLGFYDVQWLNAVSGDRAFVIIKPNFKTGRPSRIEWQANRTRD